MKKYLTAAMVTQISYSQPYLESLPSQRNLLQGVTKHLTNQILTFLVNAMNWIHFCFKSNECVLGTRKHNRNFLIKIGL